MNEAPDLLSLAREFYDARQAYQQAQARAAEARSAMVELEKQLAERMDPSKSFESARRFITLEPGLFGTNRVLMLMDDEWWEALPGNRIQVIEQSL